MSPIALVLVGYSIGLVTTLALILHGIRSRVSPGAAALLCASGVILLSGVWLVGVIRAAAPEALVILDTTLASYLIGQIVPWSGVILLLLGVALLKGRLSTEEATGFSPEMLSDALERVAESKRIVEGMMLSTIGGAFMMRVVTDQFGNVTDFQFDQCNRAMEHLLGTPRQRLVGASPARIRRHEIGQWIHEQAQSAVATGLPIRVERSFDNGHRKQWLELAITSAGRFVTGMIVDTTTRKAAEMEQWQAARTDPLTGLANRKLLMERLEAESRRARTRKDCGYAMLFFDFDGFKRVNDTLGHDAGDELLRRIADRLQATLSQSQHISAHASTQLVSRLGGDEFVVIIPNSRDAGVVREIADELLASLAEPHDLSGQSVVSTASIGVAIDDGCYGNGSEALSAADEAMYMAKRSGKGRVVMAEPRNGNTENRRADHRSLNGECGPEKAVA